MCAGVRGGNCARNLKRVRVRFLNEKSGNKLVRFTT